MDDGRYFQGKFRKKVAAKLAMLPSNARNAFVARLALTALPLLARVEFNREAGVFGFWHENNRAMYLLAIFIGGNIGFAYAAGALVSPSIYPKWHEWLPAVNGQASDAASYAVLDSLAMIKNEGRRQANTAAWLAWAAGFAYEAGNLADQRYICTAIMKDLKALLAFPENITQFLQNPLWYGEMPASWKKLLTDFEEGALATDPGFCYWLDLYKDRIQGKSFDAKMLCVSEFIPEALFEQGVPAINAYLLRLRANTAIAPLNLVRGIFIGYGEAGKTSLIRVLSNKEVQPQEEQTAGVDIHEWSVPGTDIKAHLWDFGGQVMAHATHQLFLRESCLYVLVISARSEINATEQAEYWLEHVKSFGGSAKVIIVGNRAEQADLNIDMGVLMQKYPNIVKYFSLSCLHAHGSYQSHYQAFYQEFCLQLRYLSTHQLLLTPPQFSVMADLRKQTPKVSFLSKAEFDGLCEKYEISTEVYSGKPWLLDIFDKIGIIIHFKALPFAGGYVLNPRWLTWGVYTVMYAKKSHIGEVEIIEILGKASVTDLEGNSLSYSVENCQLIMNAMREFKLCYSLPDQPNTLIIPALLTGDQPEIASYKNNAVAFELAFDVFLPRHVIPELIVTRHAEILVEKDVPLVWQYGAVFQAANQNARALVLVDYRTRRIHLWVSGDDARDYLTVLRDSLGMILGRLAKIEYSEWVVLPESAVLKHAPCNRRQNNEQPERAAYAQVLAHANDGTKVFIASSGAKYDVDLILCRFVDDKRRAAEQRAHFPHDEYSREMPIVVNNTITISDSKIMGNLLSCGQIFGANMDGIWGTDHIDNDDSEDPPVSGLLS